MTAAAARVRVSEACRELGIVRSTFFRRGWNHVFTRFRVGKQLRVCTLELGEAAQHMTGDDAESRAKAAVRRLRKEFGRLKD